MPCGNRTRLAGLEDRCLCRSAKSTCCLKRKVRESNPSRRLRALDRFRGGCRRQSACPSVLWKAPVEGLEPSLVGLTGRRLTVWPHRNVESGWLDWNQRSRAPEARASTRLSHTLISRAPSGSRTHTSAMARRQAAATSWALDWLPNCQRPKSTGRESNPRCRITSAVSCRWTTSACSRFQALGSRLQGLVAVQVSRRGSPLKSLCAPLRQLLRSQSLKPKA